MIRITVITALSMLFTTAYAGQLSNGLNNPGLSSGLNGPGIDAGGSGGNPVVNACLTIGNQLDFSDATGCNLIWGGH